MQQTPKPNEVAMKKSSYQLMIERHRAAEASQEAQRQERDACDSRERLLSTDEKVEYDRLESTIKNPPRSLAHRAALPAYLLLALWVAIVFGLLALLFGMQASATQAQRITFIVVFLLVIFGGIFAVFAVLLRQTGSRPIVGPGNDWAGEHPPKHSTNYSQTKTIHPVLR